MKSAAAFLALAAALSAGAAAAQEACVEPIEPWPDRVDRAAEPEFYAEVQLEYQTYMLEVEDWFRCVESERRHVIERSRVILDRWVEQYGDDAALELRAEPAG